jgi:hypothetical protein
MEQYLEAADKVLDAAIVNGPKPSVINKRFNIKDEKSVKATGDVYRHLDDAVAIFASWVSANVQVSLYAFRTNFPGNYRIRISAYAFQSTKPVTFHVKGRLFPVCDRGTHSQLSRRPARQADRHRVCRKAGSPTKRCGSSWTGWA